MYLKGIQVNDKSHCKPQKPQRSDGSYLLFASHTMIMDECDCEIDPDDKDPTELAMALAGLESGWPLDMNHLPEHFR